MPTEIQKDVELWNGGRLRRMLCQAAALAATGTILALAAVGCSAQIAAPAPAKPAAPESAAAPEQVSALPAASIEINYAKKDDTLASLTVTQFTGATVLLTQQVDTKRQASVVRFDGGVPVWQFHSERSILNQLSVLGSGQYHVTAVHYGKLPSGFLQDVPNLGPPAPLEADNYYVFTIERSSGALSYQVVKVNADGSLEAYDAEPRAGTSYSLCCNVKPGFIGPNASRDFSPEP